MKNTKITIAHNGTVTVSNEVRMTVSEIADLFGIFYQTAKKNIRSIEKSGVADGVYSTNGIVEGQKVYPEYYGLEIVCAADVIFRPDSRLKNCVLVNVSISFKFKLLIIYRWSKLLIQCKRTKVEHHYDADLCLVWTKNKLAYILYQSILFSMNV